MNFQTLKFEAKDGVGVLTLSRPEALNALNSTLLKELSQCLAELAKKPFSEMKALVITGSGEKAFVAGADIKEINELSKDSAQKFAELGQSIFRQIENLKIPVIAAVNGFALGGGCELALSCDFIYASENAKFGLPEVTLGLIPGFGGTVRLSRRVGIGRARELTYSGEMIASVEAQQIGLVNKVFPLAELLTAAVAKAGVIAQRAPIAVEQAKLSINKSYDQDIDTAMKTEAALFARLFESQDVREGTKAFIEKRKAQFKGI